MATENTSLLPTSSKDSHPMGAATSSTSLVSTIFIALQGVVIAFFFFGTKYTDVDYDVREYIAFRDIMAMLLLGFGYLMSFLKLYGLGAVGFTMMLSILAMQLNIPVELFVRYLFGMSGSEDTVLPMPLNMATFIDAEFAAATLMISYGVLIGRATPLQLMIIGISQSLFYAANKVLVLEVVGAEDVGGSMTIHMFGAGFGLAASYALEGPKGESASEASHPDKVSDILALIGTTILWVFWPSFVGATETGVLKNEHNCIVNTILSLMASTTMTFYLSQKLCHGKFDPVHVANSTLAGGVAIGSAGRLNIGPGWACVTGALAGAASVYGYVKSSPMLASKFGIFDTCGVANLHGYPSIVGALLSVGYIALDTDAEFLEKTLVPQMMSQIGGIVTTLAVSAASGYGAGIIASSLRDEAAISYVDGVWWHLEY